MLKNIEKQELDKKKKQHRLFRRQVVSYYKTIETILKKSKVPVYYYSIGKHIDDCVCMEYTGEKWIVYEGSRGHKIHLKSFDTAYLAGCDLLESLVIDETELNQMKNELKQSLRVHSKTTRPVISVSVIDVKRTTQGHPLQPVPRAYFAVCQKASPSYAKSKIGYRAIKLKGDNSIAEIAASDFNKTTKSAGRNIKRTYKAARWNNSKRRDSTNEDQF